MGRWLPFAPGSSARAAAWRRRPNGQRSLYLGRLYSAAKRIDLANDNRSWPPLRHSHAHTFGSIPAGLQSASRSTRSGLLEERWERCGACRERYWADPFSLSRIFNPHLLSLFLAYNVHIVFIHTVRCGDALHWTTAAWYTRGDIRPDTVWYSGGDTGRKDMLWAHTLAACWRTIASCKLYIVPSLYTPLYSDILIHTIGII